MGLQAIQAGMKYALLLACFLALPAHADDARLPRYPDTARATRTEVTVKVHWGTQEEVSALCRLYDPARRPSITACYYGGTIYAVQPTNFNDTDRLMILGHEFWHALGATHP